MGKVKTHVKNLLYRYCSSVSIPYGKGKNKYYETAEHEGGVSIPYGKGKVNKADIFSYDPQSYQFPMGKVKFFSSLAR